MNNKCWCGREHKSTHGHWRSSLLLYASATRAYCSICAGWGRWVAKNGEDVHCPRCAKTGIIPVPLSELR